MIGGVADHVDHRVLEQLGGPARDLEFGTDE